MSHIDKSEWSPFWVWLTEEATEQQFNEETAKLQALREKFGIKHYRDVERRPPKTERRLKAELAVLQRSVDFWIDCAINIELHELTNQAGEVLPEDQWWRKHRVVFDAMEELDHVCLSLRAQAVAQAAQWTAAYCAALKKIVTAMDQAREFMRRDRRYRQTSFWQERHNQEMAQRNIKRAGTARPPLGPLAALALAGARQRGRDKSAVQKKLEDAEAFRRWSAQTAPEQPSDQGQRPAEDDEAYKRRLVAEIKAFAHDPSRRSERRRKRESAKLERERRERAEQELRELPVSPSETDAPEPTGSQGAGGTLN